VTDSTNCMNEHWGNDPWEIDFHPQPRPLPREVDFAVVGGGFTGSSAAAWLQRLEPGKKTALFEAECLGAGSSGRTGGMTLAETAVGDLPGLGDVLAGFSKIIRELEIDCDHTLPGVWELSRENTLPDSPICWFDSGKLGVVKEVPGGTADPGKLVSGLARAAERQGAQIFEHAPVDKIFFDDPLELQISGQRIRAQRVLIATNAQSLDLSELEANAHPKFTLAVATEGLTTKQIHALGCDSGKPFYTIDLPYLWGRLLHKTQMIFGSGLVHLDDWRELKKIDVESGQAAELLRQLQTRVRGLHPELKSVKLTNRWGGPILIGEQAKPVFAHHRKNPAAIVLGAYSGHGVALSVYLGRWAAEAMVKKRSLPAWNAT